MPGAMHSASGFERIEVVAGSRAPRALESGREIESC
jgi:hypothetical protein